MKKKIFVAANEMQWNYNSFRNLPVEKQYNFPVKKSAKKELKKIVDKITSIPNGEKVLNAYREQWLTAVLIVLRDCSCADVLKIVDKEIADKYIPLINKECDKVCRQK